MLHSSIGNTILNGLFAKSNGAIIQFTGSVYLGLLTKLPNGNGAAHEDGTYFSEPADEGYFRVRIDTQSRITGDYYLLPAQEGEAVDVCEDKAIPAYVENKSIIMFPASSAAWDTVVGFGLFRQETGTDLPFLWGPVTSTDGEEDGVTILENEFPILRAGGFKITMM